MQSHKRELVRTFLAIANQYHDQQADEVKRARYRLILVRGSDLRWLNRERLQEVKTGLATQHKWLPEQIYHSFRAGMDDPTRVP